MCYDVNDLSTSFLSDRIEITIIKTEVARCFWGMCDHLNGVTLCECIDMMWVPVPLLWHYVVININIPVCRITHFGVRGDGSVWRAPAACMWFTQPVKTCSFLLQCVPNTFYVLPVLLYIRGKHLASMQINSLYCVVGLLVAYLSMFHGAPTDTAASADVSTQRMMQVKTNLLCVNCCRTLLYDHRCGRWKPGNQADHGKCFHMRQLI